MMQTRVRRIALLMVFLALACADADTDAMDGVQAEPAPPATTVEVPAEPVLPTDDGLMQSIDVNLAEWAVTLSSDSVSAGIVGFNVRNTGTMPHRFEIEGNGEEWATDDLAPGADVTMSVVLSPGEYRVYCPIEGGGTSHADRGMTTTLRVR